MKGDGLYQNLIKNTLKRSKYWKRSGCQDLIPEFSL